MADAACASDAKRSSDVVCRGAATLAAELSRLGESETIDVEAAMEAVGRLGLDEPEPDDYFDAARATFRSRCCRC